MLYKISFFALNTISKIYKTFYSFFESYFYGGTKKGLYITYDYKFKDKMYTFFVPETFEPTQAYLSAILMDCRGNVYNLTDQLNKLAGPCGNFYNQEMTLYEFALYNNISGSLSPFKMEVFDKDINIKTYLDEDVL